VDHLDVPLHILDSFLAKRALLGVAAVFIVDPVHVRFQLAPELEGLSA
jgi:hypothetical protein